MKKLITILTVMIVLAGAVFADANNAGSESHTLYVSATIEKVEPIFQLVYGSENPSNGTTFETGTEFTNTTASYSIGSTSSRVDVTADINADHVIVVSVKVNNKAKINQLYHLRFSDGVFAGVGIGANTYNITPKITTTPATGTLPDGISSITDPTEGDVQVQFNGTAMTANAAYEIASASYDYDGSATATSGTNHAWDKDVINPGTYTANLILTISTT